MAAEKNRDRQRPQNRRSGRYVTPSGPEVEFEPGSHRRVQKNRLGIRRKKEMDRAEFEALLAVQEVYLDCIGPHTRLTAEMLRRMHFDWLGEIYEWAGR